jgi:hypothetical protein
MPAVYTLGSGEIIEPEFYRIIPDCGTDIDIPFTVEFSPAIKRLRANAIKVVYQAGYRLGKIPADLAAACLELAAWNFNRYRGKRIGMTGNIKGRSRPGDSHFCASLGLAPVFPTIRI